LKAKNPPKELHFEGVLTNATRYPPSTPCTASSFHMSNFGHPFRLTFHNLIGGASIKLQTLYYITGHPEESTKNLNVCISICPINVLGPSFKQLKT
jgi:hypothetical protein